MHMDSGRLARGGHLGHFFFVQGHGRPPCDFSLKLGLQLLLRVGVLCCSEMEEAPPPPTPGEAGSSASAEVKSWILLIDYVEIRVAYYWWFSLTEREQEMFRLGVSEGLKAAALRARILPDVESHDV